MGLILRDYRKRLINEEKEEKAVTAEKMYEDQNIERNEVAQNEGKG